MSKIIFKGKDNNPFSGLEINLTECIKNKSIITEEISTTDMVAIQKLIDSKFNKSELESKIKDIVVKEIGGREGEKIITDIVRNCIVQLYKQLWSKRSFWMNGIVNKPN